MLNDNHHIIDLAAEVTWVACCAGSKAEADAFALAANQWVEAHPFELSECPFEEHVPPTAFFLNFESGEYDDGWGCYVHCAWVLQNRFKSIAAAAREAEKYFDVDGVSPLFLEWIIFGDEDYEDELPDGRPLYVYEPELRIYHVEHGQNVYEYLLGGGYGALTIEQVDSRPFQPGTSP